MTQFKEIPFIQKFDIIAKKERLVLDIERDKYPNEKVVLYLNGTTGITSTNLEDVLTDRPYCIYDITYLENQQTGYSIEYDNEQKIIVFHLLARNSCRRLSTGAKILWNEFTRFIITKNRDCYVKKGGYSCEARGYHSTPSAEHYRGSLDESGNYIYANSLPIAPSAFSGVISRYVNTENGSENGFLKEISNLFPAIFNVTGNDYLPLNDYNNMSSYFKSVTNGITCLKKSGKKQDIIDKLVEYPLKEIPVPNEDEIISAYIDDGIYKFATIERVPVPDNNICVVRTFNYVVNENYLFEGGRIYVGKKEINSCKKNNVGDYVAQPLLAKVRHWDFCLNKFPEEETKGTMLEYFGNIVQNLDPTNRSVGIWMFLKEPFLESLAKISSASFIDEFISNLRWCEDINIVYTRSFGITNKNAKKIFQILGINKEQFALLKDILPECMPKEYVSNGGECSLSIGVIPLCKYFLKHSFTSDISDIDIKTFEDYLNFSIDIYSLYDSAPRKKEFVDAIAHRICDEICRTKNTFPTFDVRNLFNIFLDMAGNTLKNTSSSSWNAWNIFRYYTDYINMVSRMPDKDDYKPKFSNYDDLVNMHENVQILVQYKDSKALEQKFVDRYPVWEKWTFQKDDKKTKDGEIKEKGLPFIVIYPKKPFELAKEGTKLHHCVKSYIDRVSDGETNIVFIRKKEEPEEPFFTVEITNDNHIQQVHGLQNRNADTEEGLEDFLEVWAKARHLKLDTINKVR